MDFTPQQRRVIDTRDRNILVSAAAGSGKTAVLVERIIQKITDAARPVDIDRLLVVTFTSAAAAQMRERISRAVIARLEEEPGNEHLQKQVSLIHNAQITTIDSFCLFVIRNNFNEIGIDPGFRVADESEIKMLEADVMDKLLEEAHAGPTERFLHFIECYSTGADEKRIEEAILRLYHFSMSYPFPEEWLCARLEDYRLCSAAELSGKKWFREALSYVDTVLQECQDRLHQALRIAGSPGGPAQYSENLASDLELIGQLRRASDYDTLYELFTCSSFTRLSAKKAEGVDCALKEMVKAIRDEVKKSIAELKKSLFQLSMEDALRDMAYCQEAVEELVSLTLSFKEKLDRFKRDKNIIDFPDMEHFALQILLKKDEDGRFVSGETALELQEYFEEIMIDEYQDSNEVQELLLKSISGESGGRFNRFMVGDVKQSIYKFRLARPEIFMEKYCAYAADTDSASCIRIDLSMNFRSRREVTDFTNFICSQIMTGKIGKVEYDGGAALYVGASYPETDGADTEGLYRTELMIAAPDSLMPEEGAEAPGYSEKETEALMVAERIRQLVGSFPVTDGATGEVRPAKYSDIVLLFRATAGWDEDFRRILSERGIPVHVTSRTGYFETPEIQGIVSLLRALDNPLQDIPFFGVLKLPCFGFSEEEIARIRCFARDCPDAAGRKLFLYEQVKLYYKKACLPDGAFAGIPAGERVDRAKLERLLSAIETYRRRVAYTPIKELLQQIIAETGYEAYVGAMAGGGQRRANIGLLLEKAGAFQNTSFYGLFHFIRYLETIQEQEVDFGEANILDENADVVRIMTIHKSKGLEFPICFVCGLSRQFNQMDMRQDILMDVELGIGADYIDPGLRVKRKTMRRNVVAQRMKEDARGEDLRVLYVALTRAREKLILTGYVGDLDKKLAANIHLTMEPAPKLPYSVMMKAGSYMDMILAALMRHDCMREVLEERGFGFVPHLLPYAGVPAGFALYREADNIPERLGRQIREQGRAQALLEELADSHRLSDRDMADRLERKLHFVYPHACLEGLTVKTTVSELKKASYGEVFAESAELVAAPRESYIPDFALEDLEKAEDMPEGSGRGTGIRAQSGLRYGMAVHKAMELVSFGEELRVEGAAGEKDEKRLSAALEDERARWIAQGIAGREEIACVGIGSLTAFFRSGLAQRMIAAKKQDALFREQPFVLGVSADKLGAGFPSSEMVLVQGVIDVFFYEGDEIVLADYKTDRVSCREELIRRYRTQLDYYQMALEQMTGKRVKERYLYSFYLQEEIYVSIHSV